MPRLRAQLGRWQPWIPVPAWSLTSCVGLGTHLPSVTFSPPCDGVGDSVYLQGCHTMEPSVCEGSLPPPGMAAKREGVCEGVPHRVPMSLGARPRGRLTCCCMRCRGRAVRWGKVGDGGTSSWLLCRRRHSKLKEDLRCAEGKHRSSYGTGSPAGPGPGVLRAQRG